MTHVVVLGGGVAGMSAAHELIEAGLRVTVLEKAGKPGGKAQSFDAPAPIAPGKKSLPGEHGFRFFPHFYRNIRNTMKRIPSNGRTVFDNLVPAKQAMLARETEQPIEIPTTAPMDPFRLVILLRKMFEGKANLSLDEYLFFSERILKIMACCPERAMKEFECTTWWKYLEADKHSEEFRTYLVEGLTRCLVAAKAREANVRAGGIVLTQLFYGLLQGETVDWVLNGPTDDAWLKPWHADLAQRGVDFRFNTEVTSFAVTGSRVTGVDAREGGVVRTFVGDYYFAALPVEVIARLWSPVMREYDPKFADNLASLALDVDWMTGLQFFLPADAPITNGHITFIDSPWALTAISQPQFWPVNLGQYGDGAHFGIISVDVSDWDTPGVLYGLTAKQCSEAQIAAEVWKQMADRLNVGGVTRIPHAMPKYHFLDPNIVATKRGYDNHAPLYINKVDSWDRRPTNRTPLANLYVASDYVRTDTNLATMEAANESARRAVVCLYQDFSVGRPCNVWPLPDPFKELLDPWREADCWRFKLRLEWQQPAPFVTV